MKPRISMVTLGVRDLERAVKFYGEGLGFPRMETPPGVAFFPLNGTWLSLYPREALAEDAQGSPEGSGFDPSPWPTTSVRGEVDEVMAGVGPERRWRSSRRRCSGAATAAISGIRTAICGKWPTTPISGSVPGTARGRTEWLS